MVVLQLREERETEGAEERETKGAEEREMEGVEEMGRRRKGKERKENQSRSSVLTCFSRL